MKINKTIAAVVAAVIISASSAAISAQEAQSAYSRFGYGLLNDNATSAQRQMGGVGYAMQSGRQINVMNPASYAAIDSLTFLFDMGLDLSYLDARENGAKFTDWGGGLDYIAMQFPLGKRLGMSLALLPYSSVGYSFGSKVENGSSSHEGNGGFNQLNLGLSGRIVKGLSVGANISYLFGTTYNDAYALISSSNQSLFEQIMRVRDWHLQVGVQYTATFNKRHKATVGVVYTPAKTLLGHTWVQKYDLGSASAPDTVLYTSLKGRFGLPETWGAGISYEWNNRLTAEADFTYQAWDKAKFTAMENFSTTRLCNRWRAALGFSYIPGGRTFLTNVSYRLGAYYNRDYIMVGDNHVRDISLSCGFGLPVPDGKTVINLGFEWVNRQATPNPLLKENHFNITLGVNFNQIWFFQNKIR